MATHWLSSSLILYSTILTFQALGVTDQLDVIALQRLYKALNGSGQLNHWKLIGGDPCKESWFGIKCSGSSVIQIELQGLGLSGNIASLLSNLRSLRHLDLGSNNFEGSIPYSLPRNMTYISLTGNRFAGSIPDIFHFMNELEYLNLSHNALSGSLRNMFSGLTDLRDMDLSFNNFTGDLPASLNSLSKLTRLSLKNNGFTGSVAFLAHLPLSDLNIENNHFSGTIPEEFHAILKLRIGGNEFENATSYPIWSSHPENMSKQNITSPTNLSVSGRHPLQPISVHNQKRSFIVGVLLMVGGLTLITACALVVLVFRKHRSRWKRLKSTTSSDDSTRSLPISIVQGGLV